MHMHTHVYSTKDNFTQKWKYSQYLFMPIKKTNIIYTLNTQWCLPSSDRVDANAFGLALWSMKLSIGMGLSR